MKTYNYKVMSRIRQSMDLDPGDESQDAEIMKLDKMEAWTKAIQWEGFFSYAKLLHEMHTDIFGK